ncbi:hypothetical protein M885DRAFT_511805 [Pelagophyceae sp. CCMP2097]|nr:hypothetical protein M885DRAFT_511805 [Pelagophyceae sp. CCMP2097]
MVPRLVALVVLAAGRASGLGLLRVHTRLAGAILQKALFDAANQKAAYLEEAERLLVKADEIDAQVARLGGAPLLVPRATPAAAVRPQLDFDDKQLARIVDFGEDWAPQLAPLSSAALRGAVAGASGMLYLLTFEDTQTTRSTAVPVGRGAAVALALPCAAAGRDVLVSLTDELQAQSIAHLMSALDGFPMAALAVAVDDVAALVQKNDLVLGVIAESGSSDPASSPER